MDSIRSMNKSQTSPAVMQNGSTKRPAQHISSPSSLHTVDPGDFARARRSTFLRVDLDAIWHNIQTLKAKCSEHTEVIAVIKANAYGHGSVGVAKHLNQCGLRNFAVATAYEGIELRQNGVLGHIQIFGNCVEEEIEPMLEHTLTPTTTNLAFLNKWADRVDQTDLWRKGQGHDNHKPAVVIKVDTGMSRNGCQCAELPILMETCKKYQIPVHSIMTHFAQSWDDPNFTQEQLDRFLQVIHSYRQQGVKVHAANSAAIIQGFATDLDFVRPGIAIYGLAPDANVETAAVMKDMGMRPALSWIAKPTLVKSLDAGRKVGYDQAYKVTEPERIATFSFGYADGYNRLLSGRGIITDLTGSPYQVVGRVSMDAITVHVDDNVTEDTPFYIIRNDYESPNSASNMAAMLETIPYEIGTSLSTRLPRLFVSAGKISNGVENGTGKKI